MGKKKSARKTVRLEYHHPELKPTDLLHFIELDEFSDDWNSLRLDDDDLLALQVLIMLGPERAAVIEGTGGLRKLRFSPLRWNTGKSGALRVCFAWFPSTTRLSWSRHTPRTNRTISMLPTRRPLQS
jgi:hypothetical protein